MTHSTRDALQMFKVAGLNEPQKKRVLATKTPYPSPNTSPVKNNETAGHTYDSGIDNDYLTKADLADAKGKENKKPQSACKLNFNVKTPGNSPLTGPMTMHPALLPNIMLGAAVTMGGSTVDMDCTDLNITQKPNM